ncbi:SAC3 domain-containing protein 1-like isoform X1 [Tubulanus polymorphus]|uniref:SAC3 domain-containing protein 1-like isoform X1 n=1 Tax=Tubulanus polymorphus TaxID=672921 RepID=UPI003DA566AE
MSDENMDECTVTGTCMKMCPLYEVRLRQREGLLHPFEVVPGTEKNRRPRAHSKNVVKSYSRCAAGRTDPEPKHLRPLPMLVDTVDFLLEKVATRVDASWVDVYDYAFDRLRAVRQDAVIQRCRGAGMQRALEKIVEFHVYAGYRLCEEPQARFDPKINETHAQECLKRLLRRYEDEGDRCGNRARFEAVYLLYNLGSYDALAHCLQLHADLRKSDVVWLAWKINMAYLECNYVRMFRLVDRLNPVLLCAFHRHLNHIQKFALKRMSYGFHSNNLRYPAARAATLLHFDDATAARDACHRYGLTVADAKDDGVGGGEIVFQKESFKDDENAAASRWNLLESRLLNGSAAYMKPISQPKT